ncbi:hypothetical protein ACEE12_00720 [Streptococcus suis]|nr:hypothetical protein [Streptococcus suis]
MEKLYFDNLQMKSKFDKHYRTLKWLAYKQLAFGRYTIEDNECKVYIINKKRNDHFEVIIDRTVRYKEIVDDLEQNNMDLVVREGAVRNFVNFLKNYNRDNNNFEDEIPFLVELLKKYKNKHTISGSALGSIVFFKLYSPRKEYINNEMREIYGAGYIDYEMQIGSQGSLPVIHNDGGLNGIWASTESGLKGSINDESRDCFGGSLFILRPLKKCQYFVFPLNSNRGFSNAKEVIGDKFQVLKKIELPMDLNLWEQFINSQIEKLETKNGMKFVTLAWLKNIL